MTQQDYIDLLQKSFTELADATHWLERSYKLCRQVGIKEEYSETEFDAFENLTSRFARVADFLIHRIYRNIDKLEFENHGTLIDVINRAHKRKLIASVDQIRSIKELRNEIVHEYATEQLKTIFQSVLELTPELFTLVDKAQQYGKKFLT